MEKKEKKEKERKIESGKEGKKERMDSHLPQSPRASFSVISNFSLCIPIPHIRTIAEEKGEFRKKVDALSSDIHWLFWIANDFKITLLSALMRTASLSLEILPFRSLSIALEPIGLLKFFKKYGPKFMTH